jgi:hypothetical protein
VNYKEGVKMNRQYWPAIILILTGTLLLLNQFDLFTFSKADIFSYGILVLGIFLLLNAYSKQTTKGVFGGVFFTSFGTVLTLMRNDLLPRTDDLGFAALFFSLAIANLFHLLIKSEKGRNLFYFLLFSIIGGTFIISYVGYYSTWVIYAQILKLWPVVFIVIGLVIIFKAYKKRSTLPAKT